MVIQVPRPNCPKAHHIESYFCSDPNCGLHIIAFDQHHKPMCEIVMTVNYTRELTEECHRHLYDKATKRS